MKEAVIKEIAKMLMDYQDDLYNGDFEETYEDTILRETYAKKIFDLLMEDK